MVKGGNLRETVMARLLEGLIADRLRELGRIGGG
jgi:hypothetical protein